MVVHEVGRELDGTVLCKSTSKSSNHHVSKNDNCIGRRTLEPPLEHMARTRSVTKRVRHPGYLVLQGSRRSGLGGLSLSSSLSRTQRNAGDHGPNRQELGGLRGTVQLLLPIRACPPLTRASKCSCSSSSRTLKPKNASSANMPRYVMLVDLIRLCANDDVGLQGSTARRELSFKHS